mmetsp:Transcript_166429/g.528714  ORF Transcript_166429/g.528714 Transcript_166429/m.528714 type:complete len:112 (+) Transcript_166429:1407-1742(+)
MRVDSSSCCGGSLGVGGDRQVGTLHYHIVVFSDKPGHDPSAPLGASGWVFVGAWQMGKGARHAGADATSQARKRLRWMGRQWARAYQLTKACEASKRFRVQSAQAQAATFE